MAQYLHLISNTTASNPLDVWTPSTNNVRPEIGNQFTLGYSGVWERKQIRSFDRGVLPAHPKSTCDYVDGADLLLNKYLEGDLLSGMGRAYGVELYARRKRPAEWLGSYTLGHTELKVDGINRNNWYSTRYDQRP